MRVFFLLYEQMFEVISELEMKWNGLIVGGEDDNYNQKKFFHILYAKRNVEIVIVCILCALTCTYTSTTIANTFHSGREVIHEIERDNIKHI